MMTAPADQDRAGAMRSALTAAAGVLLFAIGALGSFVIGAEAWHLVKDYSLNSIALHMLIWLVFFLSLTVAGFSLLRSGLKRRTHDLVPGPTLYFLGASLVVNGLFLLVVSQYLYAGIAIVLGSVFLYLEHATQVA